MATLTHRLMCSVSGTPFTLPFPETVMPQAAPMCVVAAAVIAISSSLRRFKVMVMRL